MSKYLDILGPTATGFSVSVPDLPGCVATGDTLEEVDCAMREAVGLHLEGSREEGLNVPKSSRTAACAEVEMA